MSFGSFCDPEATWHRMALIIYTLSLEQAGMPALPVKNGA